MPAASTCTTTSEGATFWGRQTLQCDLTSRGINKRSHNRSFSSSDGGPHGIPPGALYAQAGCVWADHRLPRSFTVSSMFSLTKARRSALLCRCRSGSEVFVPV